MWVNELAIRLLTKQQFLKLDQFHAFADDKINIAKIMISVFDFGGKHSGKWKRCCLSAFSPFPTMF